MDKYQAASILYARGGGSQTRKQFFAGLACAYENVSVLSDQLQFDHDYFGPRPSSARAGLESAQRDGLVATSIYVKRPDNGSKCSQPPHMACFLTPSGEALARRYIDKRLSENTGNLRRFERAASALIACSALPSKIATAVGLLKKRPLARDSTVTVRGTEQTIPVSSTEESIQRLLSLVDYVGVVDVRELGSGLGRFEGSYTVDKDAGPSKYLYLAVSMSDLDESRRHLRSVNDRTPLWPETVELARNPELGIDLYDKDGGLQRLLDEYQAVAESWKRVAQMQVDSLEKKLPRHRAALKRRLGIVRLIAEVSEKWPVRFRLRYGNGTTTMESDPWKGARDTRIRDAVRQYGWQSVRAHLDDAADFLTYLTLIKFDLEDEARRYTRVFPAELSAAST